LKVGYLVRKNFLKRSSTNSFTLMLKRGKRITMENFIHQYRPWEKYGTTYCFFFKFYSFFFISFYTESKWKISEMYWDIWIEETLT
jgi:hypothetical protein